jgi:hypothetical protein
MRLISHVDECSWAWWQSPYGQHQRDYGSEHCYRQPSNTYGMETTEGDSARIIGRKSVQRTADSRAQAIYAGTDDKLRNDAGGGGNRSGNGARPDGCAPTEVEQDDDDSDDCTGVKDRRKYATDHRASECASWKYGKRRGCYD